MTCEGGNAELELPAARGQLADATVEFALRVVSYAGVPARLEAECKEATGRPRSLPVAALLAGLFLLALEDRPLHLLAVTELLYRRISKAAQAALGVVGEPAEPKAFLAHYRCVRYLFHKIVCRRDPSELLKNRCLATAELERESVKLSSKEQVRRHEALELLCNELVEASLSLLGPEEWAAFSGAVGLDATPVKLFSRGPSRRAGTCASDPDGGWYVRKGDHRGEEDQHGRVKGKVAWALEATLATMAPPVGDPAALPSLALSLALGRPGEDPGGTGARVLASLARRGHKVGPVGNDRAYSSARPERFHLPVRALGFGLVFDYRIDECGIQANSSGAILVEGQWYCPAMPKDLINATIEHRNKVIDVELYDKRLAARAHYRLYHKDGPDADGYERFSCPASGPGRA